MGAFLSTDLREDVRKNISNSRAQLAGIHDRTLDSDNDDCDIGITDKHVVNRYKDVDVKGSQIVPLVGIEAKSKREICRAIKEQQRRKEDLINLILQKLEEYNDIVQWLTDGRYCAFNAVRTESNGPYKFRISRGDDSGTTYNRTSCQAKGGRFVDYFPAGTMNDPVSEDQNSYYEIDVPENRAWKELVDGFISAFSTAWRHLRRSLKQLTVPQYLKTFVLDREEIKIHKALAELDGELQNFLMQVLVKGKRPRSKLDVYQAKLEHNKNIARIIEQEDAAERIARKEYKKMRSTARAIHDAPGAGPELVYEVNHAETG